MVNRVATINLELENHNKANENTDFEEAIKLCGSGIFHHALLFLCGTMFFCAAAQSGISAYILPSAECDLKLTSEDKGFLNVAFLIGAVISALVCGIFADVYGRKNVIIGALILDSIVTIASSFSQSFILFLTCRALNGFTISTPSALVFTYLGEFQSEKQRARSICYMGVFWTIAWIILPGLAWLITSFSFSITLNNFTFNSWRLFLAIIAFPTFLVAVIGTRFPESPKFLLSQGRSEEALDILRRIYALNTGRKEYEYPVNRLILSNAHSNSENLKSNVSRKGGLTELIKQIWRQLQTIFSLPLLKYTILTCTIFSMNMFGYYGLGLWFPELFNRFENYYQTYPNSSVTVCELMRADRATVEEMQVGNATICKGTIEPQVFLNAVAINVVSLFGNIASVFLANRVSRRTVPATTMVIAGLCGFAIYFVKSSLQNLVLSCIFCLTIATANFCLSSVVVDIFPTHVGAVAICMMTCCGRLGAIASNLILGMLLDIACEVPIFLVGSIVFLGGIICLWIPPRQNKSTLT